MEKLTIAREIGDRRGESARLHNMAGELYKPGHRDQAIAYAEQALKIKEQIGDPWAEKVRQKLDEWRSETGGDQP